MIVFKLGRWSLMGGTKYIWTRYLYKGYIWTPFCYRRKRIGENAIPWEVEKKNALILDLSRALHNLLMVAIPHSSDDGVWNVAIKEAHKAIGKAEKSASAKK